MPLHKQASQLQNVLKRWADTRRKLEEARVKLYEAQCSGLEESILDWKAEVFRLQALDDAGLEAIQIAFTALSGKPAKTRFPSQRDLDIE